jgi:hypothetical protein
MDHAEDGDDDDVFIYMGGDQEVPRGVTHVRVHKSVKIIRHGAFQFFKRLVSIEIHDGVEIIERYAFYECTSLRRIKLPGVKVIGQRAFDNCFELENVEFCDKLETIGFCAFAYSNLRNVKIPKVRVIGGYAFSGCRQLTDVELSTDLERIEGRAFYCSSLRRIAIPLKANLLRGDVFNGCDDLSTVDLVGGINKTISSFLLDSWRHEMNDEIDSINQDLSNTHTIEKTAVIQQWMGRVMERIEHYKSEHYALLKKNMTQLELALWMASLHEEEKEEQEEHPAKKARLEEPISAEIVDANLQNVETARQRARVTCGANLIIPHVLSFLNDEDEFPTLNHNS